MNDNERLNYGLLLAHNLLQQADKTETLLASLEQYFTADALAEVRKQALRMAVWESKVELTPKAP